MTDRHQIDSYLQIHLQIYTLFFSIWIRIPIQLTRVQRNLFGQIQIISPPELVDPVFGSSRSRLNIYYSYNISNCINLPIWPKYLAPAQLKSIVIYIGRLILYPIFHCLPPTLLSVQPPAHHRPSRQGSGSQGPVHLSQTGLETRGQARP